MPLRLLVTRPAPEGAVTAARLRGLGHDAIEAPLLATEAVRWQPPDHQPQAVMLTSAAAARLAGPGAAALRGLPAFAVGTATAAAARAAGFGDVRDRGGSVQALVEGLAAAGFTEVLHLAGSDRTEVALPPGLRLQVAVVYRARLVPLATLPVVDWVLLYSARTAAHFAAESDRLGAARGTMSIAAISPAALAAAGQRWRHAVAAAAPGEDALLAAIGIAWQKAGATQ